MVKKTSRHTAAKKSSTKKPTPTKRTITHPHATGDPVFAQPTPTPDPTSFRDPVTDQKLKEVGTVEPFPAPRGGAVEPVLQLADVLGSQGTAQVTAIQKAGQIVFHTVGDTGSTQGPATQSQVADKMVTDFTENNAADVPSFFYHLGDVVYNFGEAAYYYDQFYEPYRNYPAPILGIPGNHDGVTYPKEAVATLDAYLRNMCSATPVHTDEAGNLSRTAMIQPGVYYTLEAPFVRLLGLYSNVLEDPGVISTEGGTRTALNDDQLTHLQTALARCKSEAFTGAVLVAVHHPPFTGGVNHGGSPRMLQDMDDAATKAGFWPHVVLSGHSHNYQRYTRTVSGLTIPYIVAGMGGHGLTQMRTTTSGNAIRTPMTVDSGLTLASYDDTHYGYVRVIVNATTLRMEFHPAEDGGTTKTPDDSFTLNLKTRAIT
jgi:Calcineurin-like phosphoesterase/Iron/zinc purple acid phosphatase-like protein C